MRHTTMKILTVLVCLVVMTSPPATSASEIKAPSNPAAPGEVLFIENAGQFPSPIRYYAYGGDYSLWIDHESVWIATDRQAGDATRVAFNRTAGGVVPLAPIKTQVRFYTGQGGVVKTTAYNGVRLVGVAPGVDVEITSVGSIPIWRVVCEGARGVCPAVQANFVEGDVALNLAQPTSTPAPLLDATNAGATADNPDVLIRGTFVGGNQQDTVGGMAVGVDGQVYVAGTTSSTDAGYTGPLFVAAYAPDLTTRRYLTFFGGTTAKDYAGLADLALDDAGNVYVVGSTYAEDFPVTPGAYDTQLNAASGELCTEGVTQLPCPDAYAARFDADGNLTYATFLGGSRKFVPGGAENLGGNDYGDAIRVDDAGTLYVVGTTNSDDFQTTPGAYDRDFSEVDWGLNPDIFVARLQPNGQGSADLLYSTYVGAGSINQAMAMDLDASGNIYVTGWVEGNPALIYPQIQFPTTPGAYTTPVQCLASWYCRDLFFFKLHPGGQGEDDMLYATRFGGAASASTLSEIEYGAAIDAAPDGTVVIAGATESADFPTDSGAVVPNFPLNTDIASFVLNINPAGNDDVDLIYSTFLGNTGGVYPPFSVETDAAGQMYVTGVTDGPGFPFTPDAFSTTLIGGQDAFLSVIRPDGNGFNDLLYSTYLGGSSNDSGNVLAVVGPEMVALAGWTNSYDFKMPSGGHDVTRNGISDGFLVHLAWGTATISGQAVDANGDALSGIGVYLDGVQQTTTGADGRYTLANLDPGAYTVTLASGYLWEPASRLVSVPPDAAGQDFVGRTIIKDVEPEDYTSPMAAGDPLTYTITMAFNDNNPRTFFDPVPAYTAYVSGTLVASAGITYETATNAITGTLTPVAGEVMTVTFAVTATVSGSPATAPVITNRACVVEAGQPLSTCIWSNEVRTMTYAFQAFLPLIMR